jgi:hypothetical protein
MSEEKKDQAADFIAEEKNLEVGNLESSSTKVVSQSENLPRVLRPKREVEPLTRENWDQRVHVEFNEDSGLHEMIDLLTGKLIACEKKCEGPWDFGNLMEVEIDGRVVFVPHGVDYSKALSRSRVHFSMEILQLMCNEIASGKSLSQVCSQKHFPSHSLLAQWRRLYPEVDAALEQAYAMRGEIARDEVQRLIEAPSSSKSELEDKKVAIDGWKWLASRDAPKRFGSKVVDVEGGGGMVINIISHIDRGDNEREVIDVTEKQARGHIQVRDNGSGDTGAGDK